MQTWNLGAGDPLSLTLAADSRLANTDPTDDQIWELTMGGGEPPALALQTTFGLRAHWLRLFPRFVRGDVVRTDPFYYHSAPVITQFYPNYLVINFTPFEGLEVQAEYWAVESQVVAGRVKLTNQSILPLAFRMELCALLNPMDRQGGMETLAQGLSTILTGETSYLQPVVYLTGGPQPINSPYPALGLEMELYPGNQRQFTWAAAALTTRQASFEAAQAATTRSWDSELARIELMNRSQTIHITTGRADWDAALSWSQSTAFQLLLRSPMALPHPGLVYSRRPDQGFSARGDGSDQSHLWSGTTPLDALYLAEVLPGGVEACAGVLRNFLTTQEESGFIDLKPGVAGQRSRRLAQPLLATLAVNLGASLPQPDWYREVFPPLLRFFETWFSPEHDADGDCLPEFEHLLQTGLEDSPIYDRWSEEANGLPVGVIESPALAAMLLRECQSLLRMAHALEQEEQAGRAYARLSNPDASETSTVEQALTMLSEREKLLSSVLLDTWNPVAMRFSYRDMKTHRWSAPEAVFSMTGSGKISLRKRYEHPQRLMVEVKTADSQTSSARVTIHGVTAVEEASETIDPREFSWHARVGRAVTKNTYLAVRRIETQGLSESDEVTGKTVDYTLEDCSLFLPLWAGVCSEDQARQLVRENLLLRCAQPYGIPVCPPDRCIQDALPGMHSARSSALLPWNTLIIEGLLRYGYRTEAAKLVSAIMDAVTASLKENRTFRQYYHAETGIAAGERGHLHGLAPVGLLLRTAGIQQISANEILIDGFNPFLTPIHVQYRKVQVSCYTDRTEVSFAGGQTITIDKPGAHRIRLS